jgi:hypothetical protein
MLLAKCTSQISHTGPVFFYSFFTAKPIFSVVYGLLIECPAPSFWVCLKNIAKLVDDKVLTQIHKLDKICIKNSKLRR